MTKDNMIKTAQPENKKVTEPVKDLESLRVRWSDEARITEEEIETNKWKIFMRKNFGKGSVTPKELMVFTRQLAATLTAGLLLSEALDVVADDMENLFFQKIIYTIREKIRGGMNFSGALTLYPNIFPNTYVALVKAGEATGKLYLTLTNLANYLEKIEHLKDSINNAVRYPIFVICFALFVGLVMVIFLIPRFKEMYDQSGVALPMMTTMLINFSNWITTHFLHVALGIILVTLVVMNLIKLPNFRYLFDLWLLNIPIIGRTIIHKAFISRFCRTLYFLLAGGVTLSNALQISAQVTDHMPLEENIEKVRKRVVAGAPLSQEIRRHTIFPRLVSKMVRVGERSGKLTEMLMRTSDYYDAEIDVGLKNLIVMIEPTLIICVGCIIAFIVVSLYLPIFKMSTLVR